MIDERTRLLLRRGQLEEQIKRIDEELDRLDGLDHEKTIAEIWDAVAAASASKPTRKQKRVR